MVPPVGCRRSGNVRVGVSGVLDSSCEASANVVVDIRVLFLPICDDRSKHHHTLFFFGVRW